MYIFANWKNLRTDQSGSSPTDRYIIDLRSHFVNNTVMPHKKFVIASSILCSHLSKVTIFYMQLFDRKTQVVHFDLLWYTYQNQQNQEVF